MSLARLLEQATPGPWRNQGWDESEHAWFVLGGGPEFSSSEHMVGAAIPQPTEGRESESTAADACLIALAPDMAQLLIDMADALAYVSDDWRDRVGIEHPAVLLTRFAELNARAGADGA